MKLTCWSPFILLPLARGAIKAHNKTFNDGNCSVSTVSCGSTINALTLFTSPCRTSDFDFKWLNVCGSHGYHNFLWLLWIQTMCVQKISDGWAMAYKYLYFSREGNESIWEVDGIILRVIHSHRPQKVVHVLAKIDDFGWIGLSSCQQHTPWIPQVPCRIPGKTDPILLASSLQSQFLQWGLSVLDNSTRIHGKLHPMMAIISIGELGLAGVNRWVGCVSWIGSLLFCLGSSGVAWLAGWTISWLIGC